VLDARTDFGSPEAIRERPVLQGFTRHTWFPTPNIRSSLVLNAPRDTPVPSSFSAELHSRSIGECTQS
jgi:hypothetical protein